MSVLMQFTELHLNSGESLLHAHAVAAHSQTLLAAGNASGILDWATAKNAQTQTLMRALAVTLGIIFIFIQGVVSRGAMARIIIALISAGIFVYAVWNITDIQERVDNEVNGLRAFACDVCGPVSARDVLPEPVVDRGLQVVGVAVGTAPDQGRVTRS